MDIFDNISHPVLLGILLVINIPLFVHYAQTVYRDEDELAENVKQAALDLASGEDGPPIDRDNYSGSGFLGAVFYVLVCASAIKIEYIILTWLIG